MELERCLISRSNTWTKELEPVR